MPIEYRYQCEDRSIVTPYFVRYWARPLMRVMPRWISANAVSVISSLFMYLGLWIAVLSPFPHQLKFLLSALCIFVYVTGDHLDGMQARRLGTNGTPRGEYVDHALDMVNTGIQATMLLTLFQVRQPLLAGLVLGCAYFQHVSIFYEQYRTNWLRFEPIGPVEAILTAIASLVLASWQPIFAVVTQPMVVGFSPAELLFLFAVLCNLHSAQVIFRRLGEMSWQVVLFGIGLIFLLFWLLLDRSLPYFLLITTLYAAGMVANYLQGHLVDGRERFSSLAPAMLLLMKIVDEQWGVALGDWPARIAALWLAAALCVKVVGTLGSLWQWWGREKATEVGGM